MCQIQPRSDFRQQACAIANLISTRQSGYGCGNDRSASCSMLHTSTASWCLLLGLLPALDLLGLDAHSSLLGPHSRTCHPEPPALEDKCASQFISLEDSSERHFIKHLRRFNQTEDAFLYLLSSSTALSCPSLSLLETIAKPPAFMQASVSCSASWGYLGYPSTILVLLQLYQCPFNRAEYTWGGVGVSRGEGRSDKEAGGRHLRIVLQM